jgi:hypothetical protein
VIFIFNVDGQPFQIAIKRHARHGDGPRKIHVFPASKSAGLPRRLLLMGLGVSGGWSNLCGGICSD